MTLPVLDSLKSFKRIHFIGIGGIGMSGLARVLLSIGCRVSGSDAKPGPLITQLRSLGCKVHIGHSGFPQDADCVVYSSAILPGNPEYKEAKRRGLPMLHRSEVLALLVNSYPSVGVAGMHGKTTTTSMVSFLSQKAALHPLCLIGGKILNFRDNVILEDKEIGFVVAEVDESDKSLLHYHPTHAIVTNLDEEHMDYYRNLQDVKDTFVRYLSNVKPEGTIIFNQADLSVVEVVQQVNRSMLSYGFTPTADFYALDIHLDYFSSRFELWHDGKHCAPVRLAVPGLHNVSNALAAFSLAWRLGADLNQAAAWLGEFQGVGRRLEVKFSSPELVVVDDYAHHPTEIQASIAALENAGRRLTVVFQPHRYTRTKYLAKRFDQCFDAVHRLILMDVYGAGEPALEGVTSQLIFNAVQTGRQKKVECLKREEILSELFKSLNGNDLVVFMGAGDVTELADAFVREFKSRNSNQ